MANRFTEAQLCEWFGWVQGSKQPAKYVHLSGRDIDNAYDKLHGVEEEKAPEKAELSPVECPRCGEVNEPGSKYCRKCGLALTLEAVEEAEEIGEERSEADELMTG